MADFRLVLPTLARKRHMAGYCVSLIKLDMWCIRNLSVFLFSCVLLNCSSEKNSLGVDDGNDDRNRIEEQETADRSDEFFSKELMAVSIELEGDDWDTLRKENRPRTTWFSGEGCQDVSYPSPFNYQKAKMTIDGEVVGNVGIRKKGWSSQSSIKPSLKVLSLIHI